MEHFRFLSTAVKDHKVGALFQTSASSVRQICRPIETDRPIVVVEYGPGTGAFTRYLLKSLHPESTVIAIELNRLFAGRLRRYSRKRTVKTPRLMVSNTDCRNVLNVLQRHGHAQADYVISGIPFSLLDDETKSAIIERTFDALSPDGRFLIYQYSFRVRDYLNAHFDVLRARRSYFNIPPLCILEARKAQSAGLRAGGEEVIGNRLETPVCVDAGER